MLWCDLAKLISTTEATDEIGDTIVTIIEKDVFVNKKSVRQSEYYQALSTGLKAEIMFEIKSIDYEEEETIEFNGKNYRIIRVYSKNGETIELVCQAVI